MAAPLPAGVSGIPHAFIIDAKGIIRHHGHPMEPGFERALDEVVQESARWQPQPAANYTSADRAYVAEQRLRRFEQQQQQQQQQP
jgi:hypothetical protein